MFIAKDVNILFSFFKIIKYGSKHMHRTSLNSIDKIRMAIVHVHTHTSSYCTLNQNSNPTCSVSKNTIYQSISIQNVMYLAYSWNRNFAQNVNNNKEILEKLLKTFFASCWIWIPYLSRPNFTGRTIIRNIADSICILRIALNFKLAHFTQKKLRLMKISLFF